MNSGVGPVVLALLIGIAIFMVPSPSFAFVSMNQSHAVQDTFFPSGANGCTYFSPDDFNQSVVQGGKIYVVVACAAGDTTYSMTQFNLSFVLNKIIGAMTMSVTSYTNDSYSTASPQAIYLSYNNSWNEGQVVFPLSQAIQLGTMGIPQNSRGTVFNSVFALNNATLSAIYANPTDLFTVQTVSNNSGGADGLESAFTSRENLTSGSAFINSTLADISATTPSFAFTLLDRNAFYDFESSSGSSSSFTGVDFSYNIDSNTITPLNGVEAAAVSSTLNSDYDLDQLNCFDPAIPYSTAPITTINFPTGNHWKICFKLQAQHAGRDFRGAIKVLNNTNNAFVYYASEYSPEYSTFGVPVVSPAQPQNCRNITISWTSTQPLTTGLRYSYVVNGVGSPIATISDGNISNSHSATIQANCQVDFPPAFATFTYTLFGNSADGTGFISAQSYNFTTTSFQSDISGINTGIWISVINQQGFPQSGGIVSLDGRVVSTDRIVDNNSATGYVYAAGFVGFGFGLHNVTASVAGIGNASAVIDVETDPFFYTIKVLPSFACIKLSNGEDNASATNNLLSAISLNSIPVGVYNITSYYVQYDPSVCNTFDANGNCIKFGQWIGYACLDGFFPQNLAGFQNQTVPVGANPGTPGSPGAQGNVVPAVANPVAAVLGISYDQTLNMFALIISIIVTTIVAYYTKSGLVSSLVFLGMLVLFSLVGWLPIWVMVVLVVIAALLISKYGRNLFMTGGD